MCRLPTGTSNKAVRKAGAPNGIALSLANLPIEEFTLAWDPVAPSPVCDFLVDARGLELQQEEDAAKEFDLVEMLVSEDKEESGYDELICQPPSVVCVPQQPMQQQAPTYYQPAVQHVYQQHPEMMGLHCSMHQPMPVVPAQFLPPKAETSVCEATYEQEAPKPRGRRNKTAEELAANEERVKKRRRESAQRSRARKNCYVKNLEYENRSLKAENEKLRAVLAQLDPTSSPSLTPMGRAMVADTDGYSAAPSH